MYTKIPTRAHTAIYKHVLLNYHLKNVNVERKKVKEMDVNYYSYQGLNLNMLMSTTLHKQSLNI